MKPGNIGELIAGYKVPVKTQKFTVADSKSIHVRRSTFFPGRLLTAEDVGLFEEMLPESWNPVDMNGDTPLKGKVIYWHSPAVRWTDRDKQRLLDDLTIGAQFVIPRVPENADGAVRTFWRLDKDEYAVSYEQDGDELVITGLAGTPVPA